MAGALAAALMVLLVATSAHAQSGSARYRFTTILDSQRDGLVATRCAAINTAGTVAVQVEDPITGARTLITKRGPADAPVVVAHTERVANYPRFCDNGISQITSNPSINELGEVGFQGNLRRLSSVPACNAPDQDDDTPRQGVFLGRGGPLTTIAHTHNAPGAELISEFVVADVPVNTLGKAALAIELQNAVFDQGLFVGSRTGRFDERFRNSTSEFDTPSSAMSINELGQVAFQDSGIVLSNPDGTFRRIVDSNAGDFAVFDPSLNILGRVAFWGFRFDGDTQVHGVFTSRGGPVTTVADSTGPYAFFQEPSLNDLGQVVFTADLDEFAPNGVFVQGVFTGPDPKADKVLQAGDRYAGVPVTSVFTCSEALNDLGEIVMTVQSENPETFEVRTFVVKATPRQRR